MNSEKNKTEKEDGKSPLRTFFYFMVFIALLIFSKGKMRFGTQIVDLFPWWEDAAVPRCASCQQLISTGVTKVGPSLLCRRCAQGPLFKRSSWAINSSALKKCASCGRGELYGRMQSVGLGYLCWECSCDEKKVRHEIDLEKRMRKIFEKTTWDPGP